MILASVPRHPFAYFFGSRLYSINCAIIFEVFEGNGNIFILKRYIFLLDLSGNVFLSIRFCMDFEAFKKTSIKKGFPCAIYTFI